MGEILQRAVRGALFDRRPYERALFEHSATADAALLVIVVSAIVALVGVALGGFGVGSLVSGLLSQVIFSLAEWLFLAVATWFVGSRLFTPPDSYQRGFDRIQTMLRMHGLAYLPVILAALTPLVAVAGIVGYVWYLAAAALGTSVGLDVKVYEGGISVLLGAAVLLLIGLVFRAPFLFFGAL